LIFKAEPDEACQINENELSLDHFSPIEDYCKKLIPSPPFQIAHSHLRRQNQNLHSFSKLSLMDIALTKGQYENPSNGK